MTKSLVAGVVGAIGVVGVVALTWAGPALGQGLYLHVLPVTTPDGVPHPDAALRLRFDVANISAFGEYLPLEVTSDDGWAVIELPARESRPLTAPPEPPEGRLAATFVIDYDEPSVERLTTALLAQHPRPSLDDLTRFTDRAIPTKARRPYDLPSRVAERGVGDCTEHAVLLTALARSVGYPARVVSGIVLAWEDEAVGAFGHAWAEIHDGSAWRTADAALLGEETVRYLPLDILEDESPGYGRSHARSLLRHPSRVEILPLESHRETP